MAVLSVTQILISKVAQTLAAANGGGDSFPNTGKEFVAIKVAGSQITLTAVASGAACNYGLAATTAHDVAYVLAADSIIYLLGPFRPLPFNDSNGRVQLTYSSPTGVTIAVFSLPPAA